MSDHVYIGKSAASCTSSPPFDPFSKVIIWYDDEKAFSAGDDTGRTLEVDCPWATQEMANNLLSVISGYVYKPFEATDALVDPAAELGDAVTVNGIYSVLASLDMEAGPLGNANIGAPSDEEIDSEYPYLSPLARELKRKLTLGANYYGTKITREKGLEIVKTDGENEKARVILNADLLAFYNDDGGEALFFDATEGKYKFRGIINVNDNFVVDKDGNLTLGGNVVFTGESSFTMILYSADKETWVEEWDSSWENTSTEVWAKYSYNGGTTWTSPMLVQGKSGKRGPAGSDGSDADVTFNNILSALKEANGTETTFITADRLGAPNIYGGKIYGAEIYAGTGEDGYASMTDSGFDVVNADNQHKIGLGLERIRGIDFPYLILGAGSGTSSTGSGVVKKFTTGLWIGDDSALGENNSENITGTGIFISFQSDIVYKVISGVWTEIGSGSDPGTGGVAVFG